MFPLGWNPLDSIATLERYPQGTLSVKAITLTDVIYQSVAGRNATADEVPPPETDTRSMQDFLIDWIVGNYRERYLGEFEQSNTSFAVNLPCPHSSYGHVDWDDQPMTKEKTDPAYRFEGIGGYKYDGYWKHHNYYICEYSREELLRQYYRRRHASPYVQWALVAPFAEWYDNSTETQRNEYQTFHEAEDEFVTSVIYGGIEDPTGLESSAVFHAITFRRYAVPESERIRYWYPANQLALMFQERGILVTPPVRYT